MEAGATIDTSMTGRPDGRNRRRERSRLIMLTACRALMRGGELRPPADKVAQASDVSVRTVFQHFRTSEGLYLAALEDAETRRTILDLVVRDLAAISPEDQRRILRAAVLGRV